MIQDTIKTTKSLRDSDEIVKSLLAWRDAIFKDVKNIRITGPNDPLLVINKILYRG